MKLSYFLIAVVIASGLRANPSVVSFINELPLVAENVNVRFSREAARVEGVYVFETPDGYIGQVWIKLPVVVAAAWSDGAIRRGIEVSVSGEFVGALQGPAIDRGSEEAADLAKGLPQGLRVALLRWTLGAVSGVNRSTFAITYQQPLHHGVFYYLPLTKTSAAPAEQPRDPPNYALQMRITANDGQDVSLASATSGTSWSRGSVALFLKNRNWVAASEVPVPAVMRFAPWLEIISGMRKCATHHVDLEPRTMRTNAGPGPWIVSDIETFTECPNAFPSAARGEGSGGVTFEACPECESRHAALTEQLGANAQRKYPTIEQSFGANSVVFRGRITDIRMLRDEVNRPMQMRMACRFDVLECYKGDLPKTVTVESPVNLITGACGFLPGEEYTVYATGSGTYYTDRFITPVRDRRYNQSIETQTLKTLRAAPTTAK